MTKKTLRGAALAIAEFLGDNYDDIKDAEYQRGRFKDRVYTPDGGDYYTATSGRNPLDPSKYPGWENKVWQEQFADHFNNRFNNRIFKLVPASEQTVKQPSTPSKRLTLATVNNSLKSEGIDAELVQGDGYLYFVGPDVEYAHSTYVKVARLNHQSLADWIMEAKKLRDLSGSTKARLDKAAHAENAPAHPEPEEENASSRGRPATLTAAIADFVSDLGSCDTESDVKALCQDAMRSFAHLRPSTQKGYIMRYRNAVVSAYGNEHPALSFLSASGLRAKITQAAASSVTSENTSAPVSTPASSAPLAQPEPQEPPRRAASRQEAVASFINAMKNASTTQQMQDIWQKEFSSLSHLTDQTKKLYVSKYYRPALAAAFPEGHPSYDIVKLPDEIADRISANYRRAVVTQNKSLTAIPEWREMVATATATLQARISDPNPTKESAMVIAAALLLLTGRRPYEIICSGVFAPAHIAGGSKNALSKWSVMFAGQTKTRGAIGTRYNESYEIPVLAPARLILDAVRILRTSAVGAEWTTLNNTAFTTLTNSRGPDERLPIREAVTDLYTRYWPQDAVLSPKCMRPLYAEISYNMFSSKAVSKNSFYARVLGHKTNDLETALSYMHYYLPDLDTDGNNTASSIARTQKRAETDMKSRNVL